MLRLVFTEYASIIAQPCFETSDQGAFTDGRPTKEEKEAAKKSGVAKLQEGFYNWGTTFRAILDHLKLSNSPLVKEFLLALGDPPKPAQ